MIVLLRHAQTDTAAGRCVGRANVPLSGRGKAMAEELVGCLSQAGFVRLCTSPSQRARDTITPLAGRMGMKPEIIPELDEIDMGEWDGLFFRDIQSRYPVAYAERGKHFADFRPPGGESFNDVADRAIPVLSRLGAGPLPVLVVTHAGVIRSVLCRVSEYPMDDLFRFKPEYGVCSVLAPARDGLRIVAETVMPSAVVPLLR